MSKITATLDRAADAAHNKVAGYIPTSKASKIAKMLVLALAFMVVFPTHVHAAEFITDAIDILGVVIIAIGGGLGIWGVVNLLEGYGNDNRATRS